ncbi:MAG: orotidine 5'-phosphate decarboxylase / HUMPS family protein, partial [Nanoarchaeota archaeon]|nr:orotidine 5'-phosphate decarboxylase / HUMPS family protein [Nanoarchaeota archaeon]
MNTDSPSFWLFPEEQRQVVSRLLDFGLLKFDPEGKLPLKSGGFTDIYISLRDARDRAEAIRYISGLFTIPIRDLQVERFVEVPDAVSCFAGPISLSTGLPYLTIREQAKEGRVSNAKMIGHPTHGESVCIIDDVITDGASKIVPIQECVRADLNVKALVVLVDREGGWQEAFRREGIEVPVYAGMKLEDVRRCLSTLQNGKRREVVIKEKNPLIVALDGKSREEIFSIAAKIRSLGCVLKVNDAAFAEGFDSLLPALSVYGRVMLDLKLHDIPNTVYNAARRLRVCAPWALTVHASGGEEMVRAAVRALDGTPTKVLAVTVLTALGADGCKEIYTRLPIDEVRALAAIAHRAG